ncbi:phosphoglucan phosphatase DSP4, amyloplastic [Tanacetum coccineum]
MRGIGIREGANREGNVSKWRKYLSPSNKFVKTVAKEFLEKASRELLGDNKSSVKGPFKLQDSDEDDDMSAEPIMSGCIKVSVISCIPTAQHPNVQDILEIGSIMFFSVLEGRYEYKYIVDGKWLTNKDELLAPIDKYGNINNYIQVSDNDPESASIALWERLASDDFN